MPFKMPFRFGRTVQENRDHVVVALSSGQIVGWGEGALLRWPYYNAETTSGAYQLICEVLAPLILGVNLNSVRDLHEIFSPVLGNKMAQAAIDFAVWDLFSQQAGVPLTQFLGGRGDTVPVGASLGQRATEQEFLQAVEDSLRLGYARIKCKISPGFPIEVLRIVRKRYPDLLLSVDANGTFDERSFDEICAYDSLGLAMIEQPFHPKNLLLSAELQRTVKTDICLDESIEDLLDLQLVGSLRAGRIVNIKPARVGGLTPSIAIRDLGNQMGLSSWVGGLMETGIGRAVTLAFATTLGESFPHDISECGKYCSDELITEVSELKSGGRLEVPRSIPGLGVTVNRDALLKYTVDHSTFVG